MSLLPIVQFLSGYMHGAIVAYLCFMTTSYVSLAFISIYQAHRQLLLKVLLAAIKKFQNIHIVRIYNHHFMC